LTENSITADLRSKIGDLTGLILRHGDYEFSGIGIMRSKI